MKLEITEKDFIHAILKSGNLVTKKTIEEINLIPNIAYLIVQKNKIFCQYFFVNDDFEPIHFRMKNFKVVYIDKENSYNTNNSFTGRKIEILDIRRNKYYTFTSKVKDISFFKDELIPLLEKLNELGSWEAYQMYLEFEKIKIELQYLQENYDELRDKYYALEETMNKEN